MRSRQRLPFLAGVITLVLAVAALAAFAAVAQEKASGVVAYRQHTMRAQDEHMKAIRILLTDYPQLLKQVHVHADAIADAYDHAPAMFPKGSGQPPSRALPAVWSDEKGFVAAARKTEEMAERLAEIAQGGTANLKAALAAFDQLQQEGCNGCHQVYAKPPSGSPAGG